MTDKQINRWLRRRFSAVGWVLFGYYVLMNLLVSLTIFLEEAKQMLSSLAWSGAVLEPDYDAIYGNAWGYVLSILVGLVILWAWKGRDYWKRKILVKNSKMRPGLFCCILLLCMGAQMVNSLWVTLLEAVLNVFGKSAIGMLETISGEADTFSMFLYASVLGPIGEEILFRGYALRSLRPFGKRFAIFGSALLFGLFHGNLLQAPYAILMGLLLGYVAVEYSIGWAIGLHMFNNLVLADLLTRLTMNWSDMAYGILNLILFGGGFLASLVILLRNRHGIRAYRQSEWMDRRCLKCFFTSSGILVLTAIGLIGMGSLFFV
ncbi:MAG: CPBP family intramembrane metalloprotease [Oscillospiraceae bacterium]|nr:CPBP family intramembrane metalloprotease [Oscillospiraceae bacterium]